MAAMETEIIPESHDLPNKPLIEAMFELRWQLDKDPARGTTAFRLLFGKYYEKIRESYPEIEDQPVSNVPEAMTPYMIRHRFRAAKNQWPVTQLGSGIMTVNETENYHWETFKRRVGEASRALFDAYPSEISRFEPTGAELRYVNMIPFEVRNGHIIDFLDTSLHTSIKLDDKLFDGHHDKSKESSVDLSIGLRLTKPHAIGVLSFGTGESDSKPGILWQIIIRSHPSFMPTTYDDIMEWTEEAHEVVDRWFFTLARGSLMETFDRGPS